ncbi:hypothetical protein [Pseudidiomarina sp. CB1]|uniref:hypothetical protein n=1 Tax=Pseudidiomarina sp. CB1 TaxID=2972484 RepID=UPI002163AFE3|nr:hypothetical protein [Pseudidiomarina sp. CB1]
MPEHTTITVRSLVTELMPKLRTIEHVIETRLDDLIWKAPTPTRKFQLETLKNEFELELMMIKMNMKHLLKRHQEVINVADLEHDETVLELDDREQTAVTSAWKLYQRIDKIAAHFNISL